MGRRTTRAAALLLAALLGACASVPKGATAFSYAVGEQPVRALRSGDPAGPRVIFVHGSPSFAEAWGAFLREPQPGTESVALDRPGYGGSDAGPVPGLRAQAEAIEPLLAERGGRAPILVGHSLGGPIIAKVAALWPERVGGIVIVAGSLSPELESLRWYNYAAKGLAWFLPRSVAHSNAEMFALKAELELLEPELARITCPVVILHGHRDTIVPFANVDYMLANFVSSESIEVRDFESGGHFIIWGERYVETIRASVAELLAAESPADD